MLSYQVLLSLYLTWMKLTLSSQKCSLESIELKLVYKVDVKDFVKINKYNRDVNIFQICHQDISYPAARVTLQLLSSNEKRKDIVKFSHIKQR